MDSSSLTNGMLCGYCQEHLSGTISCNAFPDGIPDKILSGIIVHDELMSGQTGTIVFKEKGIKDEPTDK